MSFSLKFRFQVNSECQITMCICDHHSFCSRDPTSPENLIKIFALSQPFILFTKDPLKGICITAAVQCQPKKNVQKVLLSCNSLHCAEQKLPSWRTANALLLTKACFLSQLFRIQHHDFRDSCRHVEVMWRFLSSEIQFLIRFINHRATFLWYFYFQV